MKSNQVVLREQVFSKLNCGALRLVPFVQLKKRFQLFLIQLQNFQVRYFTIHTTKPFLPYHK